MAENATPRDILQDAYNSAPYLSLPFNQSHPTHLFTMASLFGLNPKPVEKSRILELGCAAGGNLIPMAYHFPTADFLGIDLSEKQIDEGIQQILDLNIKNISLRHQSILDFTEKDGKFDYIICHGVYSWVNDEVRAKILEICHTSLSANGIAYLSYNTLPGWNMVTSVRDLMLWHTKNIPDPQQKAGQARLVLKFLVDGLQEDKSPHAQVLRSEIDLLSRQNNGYLLHDHLSSYNHPIYFHQFMDAANKQHLSYLSDAYLPTMFTGNLPAQFANELSKINNIIAVGQYMDFIRNQRFRATLLCHDSQTVNRSLKTDDVDKFYLQFVGKPDKADLSEKDLGNEAAFSFTNGSLTLKVRDPLSQQAMLILLQEQHKPIHYNTLCEKLVARSQEQDLNKVKHHLNNELNLLRSVFAGIINISSYPADYVQELNEQPFACPLARYQAQKQNYVTNRRHQTIHLDPVAKILLPLLDGKHASEALQKVLTNHVQQGNLNLLDENKQPVKDEEEINRRIKIFYHASLENMAWQALLIAKP